jgi:hypothetical protein
MIYARICTVLTALLLCTATQAQIFPHIEKRDIRQRYATEAEHEEQKQPDAQPDRTAWLAFERNLAQQREQFGAARPGALPHVATMHASVRDYVAGIVALNTEQYREADRLFRGVGHTPRRAPDDANEALKSVLAQIEGGRAYYLRAVAVSMQHWSDFADDDELARAHERGLREARRAAAPLSQLEGSEAATREFTTWLERSLDAWKELHRAKHYARENPHEAAAWRRLAAASGSLELLGRDDAPMYLTQRAALEVMIEHWPEDPFVAGGFADMALGYSELRLGRLDAWAAHFEPRPYHSEGGRRALTAARTAAGQFAAMLNALKTE